ncbi:hypothetical protein [Desulfovibrio inopinatus]|uniref:hypothetical protein n=1 Tax=Desulfovibrio inopinatus TaxID=102109 RepID=UPI000426C596|nr:hypothetical protein [Desulfovibrio inopinatus]
MTTTQPPLPGVLPHVERGTRISARFKEGWTRTFALSDWREQGGKYGLDVCGKGWTEIENIRVI